MDVNSTMNTR